MTNTGEYLPEDRIVILVGNYGSGKTEVSVSLAIHLARNHKVAIADLDIVNPYFRCREAREEMEKEGIRVINPSGEYQAADLPIILPEIRGAVQEGEEFLILDVGGDDVGARVLSSLADIFAGRAYTMLQVVNARRPFTQTVEGCLKIKGEIEAASRLSVTGPVSNTHLMDETDAAVILEGIALARTVGEKTGLPVAFVTADETLKKEFSAAGDRFGKASKASKASKAGKAGKSGRADDGTGGIPVHWLQRRMLPPWKLKSKTDKAARVLNRKT